VQKLPPILTQWLGIPIQNNQFESCDMNHIGVTVTHTSRKVLYSGTGQHIFAQNVVYKPIWIAKIMKIQTYGLYSFVSTKLHGVTSQKTLTFSNSRVDLKSEGYGSHVFTQV